MAGELLITSWASFWY